VELIEIGRLGRPHGLEGEQGLDLCTLTPDELLAMKTFLWRSPRGESRTLHLVTARRTGARMLVRFSGSADRDDAARLTNGRIFAEVERLPDPGPGVAYNFQLVGLDVVTEDGRALGTLAEIWPTPAHPVLVVRNGQEILVPATPQFVMSVSLDERRIVVRLLPGMEETPGSA
jgi:16S rRNA processing protein RimM